MEKSREKAIREFANLLQQKGYRGRFTLMVPGGRQPKTTGTLAQCLKRYFQVLDQQQRKLPVFELETNPPYSSDITCFFKIGFDEAKGFQASAMHINDRISNEKKNMAVGNWSIPGSMTLRGMFPRSKLWERGKRRFRP